MKNIDGNRIKSIRSALGLNQDDFGARLGVTNAAISSIESGRRNITEQMIKSICREYDVNYDWLKYGEGEMFENLPETIVDELVLDYELDDLDRELILGYLKLSQSDREVIKNYIKSVLGKLGK